MGSSICSPVINILSLSLPPKHQGIDQRLWFLACDMTEGRDQLVETRIYPRTTYLLNSVVRIGGVVDAEHNLVIRLTNKLLGASASSFHSRRM